MTAKAPGPVNTRLESNAMTDGDLERARAAKREEALPQALDHLHTSRAILQCYIDTIPDTRADDRYVLWAARDALDKVYSFLDCGAEGQP